MSNKKECARCGEEDGFLKAIIFEEVNGELICHFCAKSEKRRAIEKSFRCAKCEHTKCSYRRIATTGTGLSAVMDIQHNQFLAVSCQNCAFTEFYDQKLLDR